VYADIREDDLSLPTFWSSGKESCTHQRVENKELRTRPVREDALTAFALFKECAADEAKAKEKYAGTPVELSGVMGSYVSMNGETDLYLQTGQAERVKCVMDAKDKATMAAIQKAQIAGAFGASVQFVTVKGQFGGMVKEKDRAAHVVAGVIGGEPKDPGPQQFLRLTECRIVDVSELTLK
jgi:hypothetical protein